MAEDISDSESDAVEDKINDGQNQTKKLLNMRLGHAGIIVLKQWLEFNYFIDIINYSIKSRDFNLRVSYILRVLNFLIFSKSQTS